MTRRPPRSTRTDTLFPYTTLFRSAGKFDAFFMADHLAVLNMPMDGLKRSATVASFDPLTLLPALAAVTEHIGLIATASTTYNEPYHVAMRDRKSTRLNSSH